MYTIFCNSDVFTFHAANCKVLRLQLFELPGENHIFARRKLKPIRLERRILKSYIDQKENHQAKHSL